MWSLRFVAGYVRAFVWTVPEADYLALQGAYERAHQKAENLAERVRVLERVPGQRYRTELALHNDLLGMLRQFEGIYLKHDQDAFYKSAQDWWSRLSIELKPLLPPHEFHELENAWTHPASFRQSDNVASVPDEIRVTFATLHEVKNSLWAWCRRDGS